MNRKQKPNQRTLFETWNKERKRVTPRYPRKGSSNGGKSGTFDVTRAAEIVTSEAIDLSDDDLIEAAELLESTLNDVPGTSHGKKVDNLPGFDNSLGNLWIYPTNFPVREYQFSIVKSALMKNTLVSLPTGLGKTFIAAVVMYNFYRWYPQGKIIFMAPTKPLVSQQIEACYKIMGIPLEDQAEITGMTTSVYKRESLWSSKRVFFLTPQVINNDLARGVCLAEEIKCVVIDEAHKAQGKHAYCQVINQLASRNRDFRVLALSATPGTDVKSVQQVITNLLISHIEIRSEDSIDIRGFSHQRKVEKVVCKLDETMVIMRDNYLKVIEIFTKSLVSRRALFERETSSYSKYGILMARDQFRKDPPSGLNKYEMGAIEGDFATCISLLHGLELLQQHGMRSFFIFIKAMMEGDKGNMRAKSVLGSNPTFREMYENLTNMFGTSPNPTVLLTQAGQTQQSMQRATPSAQAIGYVYSHPKIAKLEEVVVQHFQSFTQSHENDTTRVMVFCQYRDSVQEITELLQTHRPLVRPMQFVGHSTTSGKIAKFTQKDQLQVVSKFRAGGYNTLISTCVGEEGLDIGDVDLIVCFDAHKSPIRLVQRMGRTGRKRKGRIVMLVTEGKEERDYNSSLSNKKSIQKAITGNSSRSLKFYEHNPRMIPLGLNPKPFKMHITVKEKEEPVRKINKKKSRKTGNPDISVFTKKAHVQQSAYLNPEQIKEWDEKLKLTAKEKEQLKTLPAVGQILCLQPKKQVTVTEQQEISLSEWTLWQNRLQETKISGHSSLTKNFVEMMEICELVKQSDEQDFDENLLPFLGGKYDKSQMELGKKKSNLDGYLTSAAKLTKMSTKESKAKKLIEERVEKEESPLKFSLDDDFVSEKPKKIFPDFKNKLTLFAAEDENELTEKTADDDTLNGIESILGDDQDVIPKSSSDGVAEKNSVHPTEKTQLATPEKNNSESLPDFDLGDWDMDESPKTERRNLHDLPKATTSPKQNDIMMEPILEDGKMTRKVDSSPLLDLIDNLTVIPTETPSDLRNPEQKHRRTSVGVMTPSSLNSISLDFNDHFGSDISDCEEGTEKRLFSKKRTCFSLGIDEDSDCEDNDPTGTAKIGESHFSGLIKGSVGSGVGEKQPATHKMYSDSKGSSAQLSLKSPQKQNDGNTCHLDMKGGGRESIPDHANEFFDMVTNLELSSKENSPKLNSGTTANEKEHCTSGTADVAADISADMFDIDFDLGGFDDDEDANEAIGKDKIKSASPIMVSKNRQGSSAGSTCPNSSIQHKSKEDTSLGTLTLSQRVENQLFFADRRKIQSGDEVPVAKVKPQMSTKYVAETGGNAENDENQDDADIIFEMNVKNPSRVAANQGKPESLKRKRDSELLGDIPSKRVKDMENSAFASPIMPTKSILKSSVTDKNSSPFDDSPLIKKKLPIQSKKLLFSPDTSNSPSSEESPASSKVTLNRDIHYSVRDIDSPIVRTKNTLIGNKQKHSTPKYQTKRKISSDSSDDDDFEIKPSTNIQKKNSLTVCVKKQGFRGRMKDFLDEEAEVSYDGFKASSDEVDEIDPEDLEEMKNFVNDATMLTQHVNDGSTIDEQAMYLQRKPDFFEEEGHFQGHNGKFKLAYGVENHMDVFSQEVPTDVSGYEEDSFVCDDEDVDGDNIMTLGEVTLLQDTPSIKGKQQRVTRRQVELNKLRKMNYSAASPALTSTSKLQKQHSKKGKPGRKRIVCFDESTDSVESGHKSINQSPETSEAMPSKSGPQSWLCPVCTLINKASAQICELCDSEKPSAMGETREESINTWTCMFCTYVNRTKSDLCDMCGEIYKGNVNSNVMESSVKIAKSSSKSCGFDQGANTEDEKPIKESNTSNFLRSDIDIIPPTPMALDRNFDVKKRLDLRSPAEAVGGSKLELSLQSSPGSPHSVESSLSTASNEDREARLKRCKQKQMEFRARMQKRRSGQPSPMDDTGKTATPASTTPATFSSTKISLKFNTPPRRSSDLINSSIITPIAEEANNPDKNVVLVDSKELSSSQDIITSLRSKHNVHVTVVSLTHCDYIVGRGTAVERRVISDLSQSSNRQKLASRFQQLHCNYDRIYLVIEQDRIKKKGFGQPEGRNSHNSQYMSTLCSLAVTNIRILYSDNQEETANILAMLASREKGLNRGIDLAAAEKANNAKDRSLIHLYSSIPKVSFVSSLYMCLNFKNFKEASSSSVEKLIKKAHMSTSSAAEVYTFFRRLFDLQMTPSR